MYRFCKCNNFDKASEKLGKDKSEIKLRDSSFSFFMQAMSNNVSVKFLSLMFVSESFFRYLGYL